MILFARKLTLEEEDQDMQTPDAGASVLGSVSQYTASLAHGEIGGLIAFLAMVSTLMWALVVGTAIVRFGLHHVYQHEAKKDNIVEDMEG